MKSTPNLVNISQPILSNLETMILTFRGQRVMLDADLARLYGVETYVLVQAVKRNLERFPDDFMFQLTQEEFDHLRSQFVSSKPRRGGRRYLPYVFTEHGVAMLSSVLRSPKAIQVNISIMRAFSRLRQVMISNEKITRKVEELEQIVHVHDDKIQTIFDALHKLIEPPPLKKPRRIGFDVEDKIK